MLWLKHTAPKFSVGVLPVNDKGEIKFSATYKSVVYTEKLFKKTEKRNLNCNWQILGSKN